MKLHELREKRSAAHAGMKSLVDTASAAGRDLTADEAQKFDAFKTEERALADQIQRHEHLADLELRTAAPPSRDTADNLAERVSVVRVLRAQMEGRSLTGAELEYAQEAERRTGRKAEGVFVPFKSLERRAGVNTTTTAPNLVATESRPDLYIGPLREALLARTLGVRTLTGLVGNVTVPKYGSGLTTGWVTEGQAVPEGVMAFSGVGLSPKHVGGKTEMSRQLIQQSSPDIEALVREDLAFLIAKQIDAAIIAGTGKDGQPLGVLNTAGIQKATLTPTWAAILGLLEKLDDVNVTNARWLTTAAVRTLLGSEQKVPDTSTDFLYAAGQLADLPLSTSKNVPAGTLILGDWSQVMLGVWSEVDILVNPYSEPAYSRGGVQVRAMATVDVAVRHPEGFVVATSAE